MKTKKFLTFIIFTFAAFLLVGSGCDNRKKETTEDTKNVQTTQKKEATEDAKKEENVEDIKVGSVENDLEDLEKIQESVDQGSQPWRLDPYMVALSDGVELGFDQEDIFTLISEVEMGEYSGTGEAEVEAVHNEIIYIIQLIQPVKQGEEGIWAINSVRKK